jgi:hypothetical protein
VEGSAQPINSVGKGSVANDDLCVGVEAEGNERLLDDMTSRHVSKREVRNLITRPLLHPNKYQPPGAIPGVVLFGSILLQNPHTILRPAITIGTTKTWARRRGIMRIYRIYLFHPREKYLPGVAGWVSDVEMILRADNSWDNWDLIIDLYDDQNTFAVQPLFVKVLNKPGPVILLEKVQRKAFEELRKRLRTRAVILVPMVTEAEGLWEVLAEARTRFESGEPFLPRKFIIAVLIVRKLRKGNYWAGKEKGYLWYDDLAKGRGVDERYADIAQVVANDLLQQDILIFKTSQGAKKYALNPKRKPEIHAIANDGTFWNQRLEAILMKDKVEISAYLLYEPRSAQRFIIEAENIPTFECSAIAEAISHVLGSQDCPKYQVRVRFDGDHILHETIQSKNILLQFLEGFL